MTNPNDIKISDLQEIDPKSPLGVAMGGMFRQTKDLRFVRRALPLIPGMPMHERVLQQAWTNERGAIDWKDVPTWDEASGTWVG